MKQIGHLNKWTAMLCVSFALFFCFQIFTVSGEEPKRTYLAYNIFKWPSHNMICLNFNGTRHKIPVGTLVDDVELIKYKRNFSTSAILFVVADKASADKGKLYYIYFTERYHPGKAIEDYRDMMFTDKTFAELTEGFTEVEKQAIKNGQVVNGMRKKAVLMCLGPPGERNTPSMDSDSWLYYANRRKRFRVLFQKNEATGFKEVVNIFR